MKLPEEIKTEKMAIKQSILMWHWLCENSPNDKNDYFIVTNSKLFADTWLADCPCCQLYMRFYKKLRFDGCKLCPLGTDEICNFSEDFSAFQNWSDGIKRKQNAKKILRALILYWKEKGWKDKAVEEVLS